MPDAARERAVGPAAEVTGSVRRAPPEGPPCASKIILPNAIVVLLVGLLSYVVVRQRLLTLDDPATVKAASRRDPLGAAGVVCSCSCSEPSAGSTEHGTTDALRDRLQNLGLEDKGRRENDQQCARRAQAPRRRGEGRLRGSAGSRRHRRQRRQGRRPQRGPADLRWRRVRQGVPGARRGDQREPQRQRRLAVEPLRPQAPRQLRAGARCQRQRRSARSFSRGASPISASPALSDGAAALVVLEGGAPKVKAKANETVAPGLANDLEGSLKDIGHPRRRERHRQLHHRSVRRQRVRASQHRQRRHRPRSPSRRPHLGRSRAPTRSSGRSSPPWASASPSSFIAGWILGGYVTEPVGAHGGEPPPGHQRQHQPPRARSSTPSSAVSRSASISSSTPCSGSKRTTPTKRAVRRCRRRRGHFQEAMAVDESRGAPDAAQAAALAAEPEAAYYARLYREYIDAKRANGEARRPHHRAGLRRTASRAWSATRPAKHGPPGPLRRAAPRRAGQPARDSALIRARRDRRRGEPSAARTGAMVRVACRLLDAGSLRA